MNIVEFKEPKTDVVIRNLYVRDADKYEHYNLYVNDEHIGRLEKSDIRLFIEVLDYNDIECTELLINGVRFGNLKYKKQKDLINYLDYKIHHE